MQISKGVEWTIHAATLLAALPNGRGLSADALAEYHGVPAAYMAKQMQALSKAGIVTSQRGAKGGYRLAKQPDQITLWDITAAVDGTAVAFRCMEIRQNGPCATPAKDCKAMCPIAKAFHAAETAFRTSLRSVKISDVMRSIAQSSKPEQLGRVFQWMSETAK